MRHFAILAGTCLALAAGLSPALATPSICLRGVDIDHTDIKSDKLIVFYMRDRSVYRNDLPFNCPTLASATEGFTYEATDPATDELCENLGTFKVNDTHITCEWGKFTKVQ